MAKSSLQPINKIETHFNPYDPTKKNEGHSPEIGNYDWYLYQYRIERGVTNDTLRSDEYRNSLPPVGQFTASKFVDYQSFFQFLLMNYQGWAPYGTGMPYHKAYSLAENFVKSFLSCDHEQAVFIEYAGAGGRPGQTCNVPGINSPFLISGVYGVLDPINHEFFVLIMGGSD